MSLLNVLDQTLKDKEGRWSRKSLTMFVSFSVMMAYIVADAVTKMPVLAASYRIGIDYTVIGLLAAMATGQSALTVLEKVKGVAPTEIDTTQK